MQYLPRYSHALLWLSCWKHVACASPPIAGWTRSRMRRSGGNSRYLTGASRPKPILWPGSGACYEQRKETHQSTMNMWGGTWLYDVVGVQPTVTSQRSSICHVMVSGPDPISIYSVRRHEHAIKLRLNSTRPPIYLSKYKHKEKDLT
jgi:hypothetical protein